MKYRNTYQNYFDICKAFFHVAVCYASNLKGVAAFHFKVTIVYDFRLE